VIAGGLRMSSAAAAFDVSWATSAAIRVGGAQQTGFIARATLRERRRCCEQHAEDGERDGLFIVSPFFKQSEPACEGFVTIESPAA